MFRKMSAQIPTSMTVLSLALVVVGLLIAASLSSLGFAGSTRQTATGIILAKEHKPEGTYTQTPAGARREGFWTPTSIPIAEAFIFDIQLDSPPGGIVRYSTNVILGRRFEKGQKVELDYEVRGSIFGKRAYVLELRVKKEENAGEKKQ